MQSPIVMAILMGLAGHVALATSASGSPLPKVVKLLQGLKATLTADGDRRAKEFQEFKDFCHANGRDMKYDIDDDQDAVEDDEAVTSRASADISSASSKIEDQAAALSEAEGQLTAATAIRNKEKEEFATSQAELVDTISALERANNVLQRKANGATSFVETNAKETPVESNDIKKLLNTLSTVIDGASLDLHDKRKLTALMQASESEEDEDGMDDSSGLLGAPAVAKYKSHSGTILDLLEDLKQKAESSLNDLRKEEKTKAHNFNMLSQSVTQQMNVANGQMAEAKDTQHMASQLRATAQGEYGIDSKELDSDKFTLNNLDIRCRVEAEDYDETVKSMNEELGAIKTALEALATVKPNTGYSFLQSPDPVEKTQFVVSNMLRKLATDQKSAGLMQLAGRVSSALTSANTGGADPFAKVKSMVSAMINKLQKEAGEEASHKAYCDKETAETKAKIEELTYTVDKFQAQIDKAKAKAAAVNSDIAQVQQQLATIQEEQGEADKLREEQKATYKASKADLEQGVAGVQLALKTLREYYDKDSDALLLQQPVSAHSADKGTGTSVISILEMVEGDMSKELSAIKVEEEEAESSHTKLTEDNKRNKLVKEQTEKFKKKDKINLTKTLSEYTSDLDGTQSEMDAILDYSKKINDTCNQPRETYESRASRRQAEIDGLKEAVKVLEGDASMLQVAPRQSALRGVSVVKH